MFCHYTNNNSLWSHGFQVFAMRVTVRAFIGCFLVSGMNHLWLEVESKSLSAHLNRKQFWKWTSSLPNPAAAYFNKKISICKLYCLTTHLVSFFFFLVHQASVNLHVLPSSLGFTIYCQHCTSIFVLGQLVPGWEEDGFTEEVSFRCWRSTAEAERNLRLDQRSKGSSW